MKYQNNRISQRGELRKITHWWLKIKRAIGIILYLLVDRIYIIRSKKNTNFSLYHISHKFSHN